MGKFYIGFNFKDCQIVKHALQHYVTRDKTAIRDEKDISEEKQMLKEITELIEKRKQKYKIDWEEIEL